MSGKKGIHSSMDEYKKALEQKQNAPLEELTKQLQSAEEEAKTHYDKLLRAMAELENYKKRTEREKGELIKYGNENLIMELLPILDGLDKVLEHLPDCPSQELKDFVAGVELISKQLTGVLERFDLKQVEISGKKFDPTVHEAVAHIPNEDVEQDCIVEQHRKGYMLGDRLIRPALVTVSKGKE